MNDALLFIPDISGFTEFVQNTEIEHSQHVISELLEVLIAANDIDLELAEIEGDALFFYKDDEVPSTEMLLAQIETMFTAFYSHLKLLENNRICPCNACSSAPNLKLKIVAHIGQLQYITVQNNKKPFGTPVIETHRLLKNSIPSDNYILISQALANHIELKANYKSKLYAFDKSHDAYDGKTIEYLFAEINNTKLNIKPYYSGKKIKFKSPPEFSQEETFPISANLLLELITNYKYRHAWVEGEIKFEYDHNEVTRLGTEHVCVINEKHLNFTTVTKSVNPGQLVYGEMTNSLPPVKELYQFYIITPLNKNKCVLKIECYKKSKSILQKLLWLLFINKSLEKATIKNLSSLKKFVLENQKHQIQ